MKKGKHSSKTKNPPANSGDRDSIPGLGRSSGEENGNPLQDSCLENSMNRGAWQATVHGVTRVGHNLASKPPVMKQSQGHLVLPPGL